MHTEFGRRVEEDEARDDGEDGRRPIEEAHAARLHKLDIDAMQVLHQALRVVYSIGNVDLPRRTVRAREQAVRESEAQGRTG